jgi:hypothetical protein
MSNHRSHIYRNVLQLFLLTTAGVSQMPNPFVDHPSFPLFEVKMFKAGSSAPGPMSLTEYVRAMSLAGANEEARRRRPDYNPTAGTRKIPG